jgi:hypothetical protein
VAAPVGIKAMPDGLPWARLHCIRPAGALLGDSHRLRLLRVVLAVVTHDVEGGVQVWCLKKTGQAERCHAYCLAFPLSLALFPARCPSSFTQVLPPPRTSLPCLPPSASCTAVRPLRSRPAIPSCPPPTSPSSPILPPIPRSCSPSSAPPVDSTSPRPPSQRRGTRSLT